MKILHVVPTYLPARRYGGPIYSVHGLCKATAAQGHEVHVFTTNVDGRGDSDVPLNTPVDLDGVKVWYFPSRVLRRLYFAPGLSGALRRLVDGFDIVHLHSVFLWPTWAAARAARRAGVPYVLSPRGMLDKRLVRRKSRWLKIAWIGLIEKRNLEKAGQVLVTSSVEEREMAAFKFRLHSVVHIPNGTATPGCVGKPGDIGEDVTRAIGPGGYVLYLGRIHWKKGLDRLIDAWGGRRDWRLVIAGNDEEDYARALRARMEAAGAANVELIVRSVSDADKEALFTNARLFVLPSYSENFGNTVLEAMARGVPVLVTEEVGAAELVTASGAGMVVSGPDLGAGLDTMLSNPRDARTMGDHGRAYAAQHCTWDAVARRTVDAYQRCIQEAAGG